jgi:cell wall-associated NlpC family hydrolase
MRAHLLLQLPNWPQTLIRRRISGAFRVFAVIAAFSCALAAAPAASARSVTGEYTPAAVLTTDAPIVLASPGSGTALDQPGAEPMIVAPLIEAPAFAAPTAATPIAPSPSEPLAAPVSASVAEAPAESPAAAPSSAPVAPASASASRQATIAAAIAAAESMLGAPYSYGSAGPYAFDCSGFTRWVYLQAGIELPHYSGAQWANTIHIPIDQLQPGDLVFNWGFGGGDPDHVGLYLGDGMMIHAPNGGGSVRYDSIWWWTGASVAAGRLR